MMRDFNVKNEFGGLREVIVGYGNTLSNSEYLKKDPEAPKWNQDLMLRQQREFFEVLEKYGVKLKFVKTDEKLPWQMWTRDIGFVINNNFFYSKNREFVERVGEIDSIRSILDSFNANKIIEIPNGTIEGGDVLVDEDEAYVGLSYRTNLQAVDLLRKYANIRTLKLPDNVMHLDTRLTILGRGYALILRDDFEKDDIKYLESKYNLLGVTRVEALNLGTNVFVVNPETIVVAKQHNRIIEMLRKIDFNVETVDYSEPIKNLGAFRCTTLPLIRG